ncbi:YncE family protein [Bacteroides sp. 214]|uniref:YncE family protein n=1 Tax=Bacteroides sp. 214 TaxID=2302935 RepID=UPI0013CF55D4|nr:YncE family protein [Bacteroides sp. 214]NDW12628.1 YncE family protein [Bacteroides sp. 214]
MKKLLYIPLFLFLALLGSCDDMEDYNPAPDENETDITEIGTAEMYILSEGLFNLNNSALARYTFKNNQLVPSYFLRINQRGLGDTANDMALYGSKLYVVVNVSSQLEVIDFPTGKTLKRIPVLTANGSSRQPRNIAFHKEKAYLCSFDGTVARIDTASLAIEEYVTVGRNPDDLCVQNAKLYVSNSGGLDQPHYDNTVSVIDIATFKELKKITVGNNPGKIAADDYGNVFVSVRGDLTSESSSLVQIDSKTDEVLRTIHEPVLDFAIDNERMYLYSYNHHTKSSAFKVYDLLKETIIQHNFIQDGTQITTPYAITVNPYSGNVYMTDAYDYKVRGDVLCFDQQGVLQFRLNNVGINPNAIVFSDIASKSVIDDDEKDPDAPSAFASKVLAYVPAPGQFMNTTASAYRAGYTEKEVLAYATEQVKNRSLISLGAYGGYIILGFDQTIPNVVGAYDFKIYANANYNSSITGAKAGSSEPGIVLVSKDSNGNGLPDDEWYELAGSEYHSDKVIQNYEITYYRPSGVLTDVRWTDNQGGEGVIPRNTYHTTNDYYPAWVTQDQLTFVGSRLPNNGVQAADGSDSWLQYQFPWGYADNHPNNSEYAQFKIDWAVDSAGNAVMLDGVDFVKIYTAVNQVCGWMGENSTEVSTIENLHFNNNTNN